MKKDREEDAELERIRGRGWEVEAEDEETTAGQKRLCMVFIVAVVVEPIRPLLISLHERGDIVLDDVGPCTVANDTEDADFVLALMCVGQVRQSAMVRDWRWMEGGRMGRERRRGEGYIDGRAGRDSCDRHRLNVFTRTLERVSILVILSPLRWRPLAVVHRDRRRSWPD